MGEHEAEPQAGVEEQRIAGTAEEQEALNEAANALRVVFESWRASRMVKNLIGTGPVPTFAPPFVPVGPVVGGTAFAPPPAV